MASTPSLTQSIGETAQSPSCAASSPTSLRFPPRLQAATSQISTNLSENIRVQGIDVQAQSTGEALNSTTAKVSITCHHEKDEKTTPESPATITPLQSDSSPLLPTPNPVDHTTRTEPPTTAVALGPGTILHLQCSSVEQLQDTNDDKASFKGTEAVAGCPLTEGKDCLHSVRLCRVTAPVRHRRKVFPDNIGGFSTTKLGMS